MANEWMAGTTNTNFAPTVSVSGVGRVGSYTSAVQRHRSRARKYWVVTYYDGTRSETGYKQTTVEELGHFKTAAQAAVTAVEFARTKGWTVTSYVQSLLPVRGMSGRYDYKDLNQVCVCGHTLGEHCAANPTGQRDCLVNGSDSACEAKCKNFRKARKQS